MKMQFAHFGCIIKSILFIWLLFSVLVGGVYGEDAQDSTAGSNSSTISAPYVPGEIIVKYKDGTVAALAAEGSGPVALESIGAEVATDFSAEGLSNLQALEISGPVSVKEAIEELESSPYVAYAEPNYIISLSLPETVPAGLMKKVRSRLCHFQMIPSFLNNGVCQIQGRLEERAEQISAQ
jgi:hypothetical protein